jgi:hypothetical protein
MIFSTFGFVAGLLQLSLIKNNGGVLMVLGTALTLPLSNLAFSYAPLMGGQVEPFSPYDIAGLVVGGSSALVTSI